MKGIIKDKLTTLTLENLKEHRERDAKELAKQVKSLEKAEKKNMDKCDI